MVLSSDQRARARRIAGAIGGLHGWTTFRRIEQAGRMVKNRIRGEAAKQAAKAREARRRRRRKAPEPKPRTKMGHVGASGWTPERRAAQAERARIMAKSRSWMARSTAAKKGWDTKRKSPKPKGAWKGPAWTLERRRANAALAQRKAADFWSLPGARKLAAERVKARTTARKPRTEAYMTHGCLAAKQAGVPCSCRTTKPPN